MTSHFTTITSHAVPLDVDNVDTDQIIPARYLKTTSKDGLADGLFRDWRVLPDGSPNPDFVLNDEASRGAEILVAGANFGSGSSREHAPWALTAGGFRAVVARSFADIFKSNALKNGLLPVAVDDATHQKVVSLVKADRAAKLSIDLESQTLSLPDGTTVSFDVDDFAKHCLLHGIDQLGYLLGFEQEIASHEQQQP